MNTVGSALVFDAAVESTLKEPSPALEKYLDAQKVQSAIVPLFSPIVIRDAVQVAKLPLREDQDAGFRNRERAYRIVQIYFSTYYRGCTNENRFWPTPFFDT